VILWLMIIKKKRVTALIAKQTIPANLRWQHLIAAMLSIPAAIIWLILAAVLSILVAAKIK